MGVIFNFFASVSGHLLWFFFDAVSNYAIAITLFAIVVNLVLLPSMIKRQKNMAMTSRLASKDAELRKKYEKNPRKYQEEKALLYEKEGVNPMAGCFTSMILPILIMFGIFGAVARPLENTLHIPQEKVNSVVSRLKNEGKIEGGQYEQLQIVRNFNSLKDDLKELSAEEFADVEEYSTGFNLFGINLLGTPQGSGFSEMLWIIPLLSFLSSAFSLLIVQKMNGSSDQLQGCSKLTIYIGPIFTTYIAYTVPAAVGFYWFLNGLLGGLSTIILNKFYNVYTINAKAEASRYAFLEIKEEKITSLKENAVNDGEEK